MPFNRLNLSVAIRKGIVIPLTIIMILALVGCGIFSTSAEKKDEGPSMPQTELTVYSSFQDQFFYQYYGNYLIQKFPNIKFRLIQSTSHTPKEAVQEIEQAKPDLIITWKNYFDELQKKNLLTDLNPLIRSTHFNLQDYYPEMITSLQNDAGQLNGLSPTVRPSVVFYNKNLFDVGRIDYPVNQMSWTEMLALIQRFKGSGITGFTGLTPAMILSKISETKNWNIVDQQRKKLFFNEQEWTNSIKNIIDSARDQNLSGDTGDLFLQGKAAMYFGGLDIIPKLLKNNSFPWGVVTTPVDSLNRNMSSDIFFYDTFCIPEGAVQKDAAWKVIQALLSEDAVTYIQNNSILGSVSTLNKYMNSQYSGIDLSEVWKQKINTNPYLGKDLSRDFVDQFDEMMDTVLNKTILSQSITPEDCMKEIEEKANMLYQSELLNKKRDQLIEGEDIG